MCYVDRRVMSVEKFAILIGEGANGKSVIRDVIAAAIGADNVKAYDAQQLTRSDLIPFLVGKRIIGHEVLRLLRLRIEGPLFGSGGGRT